MAIVLIKIDHSGLCENLMAIVLIEIDHSGLCKNLMAIVLIEIDHVFMGEMKFRCTIHGYFADCTFFYE